MGGCSVMNCSNSAKKGFRMLRIPQDLRKRKLWLEKMKRTNWEPGTETRVCEEHFTSDMWELSQTNRRRKLKANAIPTIFPEAPIKEERTEKTVLGRRKKIRTGQRTVLVPSIRNKRSKNDQGFVVAEVVVPENVASFVRRVEGEPLRKRSAVVIVKPQSGHQVSILRAQTDSNSLSEVHSNTAVASTITPSTENDASESYASPEESALCNESLVPQCDYLEKETCYIDESILENCFVPEVNEDTCSDAGNCTNNKEAVQKRRIFPALTEETMIKIIDKQHKQLISLRNKLRSIRKQQSKRDKNVHNVHKNVLEALFSEEQIRALVSKYVGGGTGKVHKWSERTIKTALRLKFTCGNTGYDELLRMGFPFPSQRTLRESLEIIKFPSEVSDDIVDLLRPQVNVMPEESENEYSLELDETAITSQEVYDASTQPLVGNVTIPLELT